MRLRHRDREDTHPVVLAVVVTLHVLAVAWVDMQLRARSGRDQPASALAIRIRFIDAASPEAKRVATPASRASPMPARSQRSTGRPVASPAQAADAPGATPSQDHATTAPPPLDLRLIIKPSTPLDGRRALTQRPHNPIAAADDGIAARGMRKPGTALEELEWRQPVVGMMLGMLRGRTCSQAQIRRREKGCVGDQYNPTLEEKLLADP